MHLVGRRVPRMRSFETRIVLFFSALLLGVQGVILVSVYWVSRTSVIEQLDQNLAYAEQFFNRLLTQHGERIASETHILVADFGFRTTVSQGDARTIGSALQNLALRIRSQRAYYIDLEGGIVADTSGGRHLRAPFMFPYALKVAEERGRAVVFGVMEGTLFEWAIVPVLAPIPIGYVAVALTVDQGVVHEFRHLSTLPLDISLVEVGLNGASHVLASSLSADSQEILAGQLPGESAGDIGRSTILEVGGTTFISRVQRLPDAASNQAILAVLQIDLAAAMKPYRMLMYGVFGLMVFGLLVSLLGGLLIARKLAQPVRDLASATQRFMDGQSAEPLPVTRRDELGLLAETFNRAAHMAAQMSELEQKDQRRRELVATVSHDLRTPLTSLHGFLETLQRRADQLPADEHQRFVAVALKQTEKVSRLAQELFELAKLECDESSVQWEDWCLPELVQDVVQKFQLRARQRGIDLSADLPRDMPMVRADIGLIERVLTNLIDNALKNTPAGGSVHVGLQRNDDGVAVRVEDTGIGIAPNRLPSLFDWGAPRSHRSPLNVGGLGLIIVARILRLHGRDISAESEPGRGAVFRFVLPATPIPSDRKQSTGSPWHNECELE